MRKGKDALTLCKVSAPVPRVLRYRDHRIASPRNPFLCVTQCCYQVVLSYLDSVTNTDMVRSFSRKLAPPLVTLLNSEPETQYVALRNINLIVQKRPGILESEIKARRGNGGVGEVLGK